MAGPTKKSAPITPPATSSGGDASGGVDAGMVHRTLSRLETQVEYLHLKISSMDDHVDSLRMKVSRAEGVILCAAVLIPMVVGAIIFFFGNDIKDSFRAELSKAALEQQLLRQQSAPTPEALNPPK